MCLKPSLTNSWSSAMRICAGMLRVSGMVLPFVVGLLLLFSGNRQGDLRHYRRPAPRFATDLEAAAEQRAPVVHTGEPHPRARTVRGPCFTRVEASPPVSNLEPHDPVVA